MDRVQPYHIPVLLNESVGGLRIVPSGIYVDATFGGGGHTRAILHSLGKDGKLFGFDQDANAEANAPDDARFTFVRANFRYLYHFMRYHGVLGEVDGLLADLGVSSHHFDSPERGFSYRFEGKLDMRMNTDAEITAADIINTYDAEALADIFHRYGEVQQSRKLAALIVEARKKEKIDTVETFLQIIAGHIRMDKEKKTLSQIFQALRMEVNDEVTALKDMLAQLPRVLRPGGRMVVITYHSIEDRIVKNFFRTGNFEGEKITDFYGNVQTPFRVINNKVISPTETEMENNPRARSAKLRVAEMLSKDEKEKQ